MPSHTLQPTEVEALSATHQVASDPVARMRERLAEAGQWQPGQMAGRRWAVACVSLEVTQRCNLDCTLCYLSESAESVRDFPLEEIFRRIDLIRAHYGPGTDVQVSGGEPTLRRRDELVAIVKRLVERGLRPALLTNGIKASRELLTELASVGLADVAFHVDTTQQRAGHTSEESLNALRLEYIDRARGLSINVFFNTTVHAGNFDELTMLGAFFTAQADVVRFASFQLQADTGRGVWGSRDEHIGHDSVHRRLQQGAGSDLNVNVLMAGHHDCNRSAVMLVTNGHAYDAFADAPFIGRVMRELATLSIDRSSPMRSLRGYLLALAKRPRLAMASLLWAMKLAWRQRADLIAARGRVHKLTFFTHNFMDACSLDHDRIETCVFMAMTQDGPMSMCAYNARRDSFLLKPLATNDGLWQPLKMPVSSRPQSAKLLKGRSREAWEKLHPPTRRKTT